MSEFKCPLCDGEMEKICPLKGQESAYICKCVDCGKEIPIDKRVLE